MLYIFGIPTTLHYTNLLVVNTFQKIKASPIIAQGLFIVFLPSFSALAFCSLLTLVLIQMTLINSYLIHHLKCFDHLFRAVINGSLHPQVCLGMRQPWSSSLTLTVHHTSAEVFSVHQKAHRHTLW